jgi:hypothetical protein
MRTTPIIERVTNWLIAAPVGIERIVLHPDDRKHLAVVLDAFRYPVKFLGDPRTWSLDESGKIISRYPPRYHS